MSLPLARRVLVAALVGVLLAPAVWMREICADDWADETSPTDNPATPGPDVFANQRFEDGVQSMPNLVQATPAPDALDVLPIGRTPFSAHGVCPGRVSSRRFFSGSPRAPPVSSLA